MAQKKSARRSGAERNNIRLSPAANDNYPHTEIVQRLKRQEEEARDGKRVRQSNEKLWQSLDDAERRAAHLIYIGFLAKFSELGVRTQRFLWMPRGNPQTNDYREHLIDLFTRWATVQGEKYFDVLAALEVIIFGKSCRQVDSETKRRKGFAKENLITALREYSKIKMQHNVEND